HRADPSRSRRDHRERDRARSGARPGEPESEVAAAGVPVRRLPGGAVIFDVYVQCAGESSPSQATAGTRPGATAPGPSPAKFFRLGVYLGSSREDVEWQAAKIYPQKQGFLALPIR